MSDSRIRPACCSLSEDQVPERQAAFREVGERALRGASRQPAEVRLCYEPEPGVLEELRALVAAERECCATLSWELEEHAHQVTLVVRAPADAAHGELEVLDRLWTHGRAAGARSEDL